MEVQCVLWTFYFYWVAFIALYFMTIVLRRRACLFGAVRLSAGARILKTLTLWTPFVIGLTKRMARTGQTEDTSSAQIVSVKQIAPFFARSGGDRWRYRVHCGHCHPQLTMWQLLKRKARTCLADTLFADARFLSLKCTDYRQSLHLKEVRDSLIKMLRLPEAASSTDIFPIVSLINCKLTWIVIYSLDFLSRSSFGKVALSAHYIYL